MKCGGREITIMSADGASPPSLKELTIFMAKNTAKLGSYPPCEIAPYEFSGRDYCMLLAACIPASIALNFVNWSPNPLGCQLQMNLQLFCEAASRLAYPGVPLSSLHPTLLLPSVSCLWHHLKVQHWLFVLAQRSPPPASFNPSALRQRFTRLQCGEPFLDPQRVRDKNKLSLKETCPDLNDLPPVTPQKLAEYASYFTALEPPPLPPINCSCGILEGFSPERIAEREGQHSEEAHKLTSSSDKEISESANSMASASTTGRNKPWQSYSKPWNLPSLAASKAKKEKEEASIKKRVEKARQDGVGVLVHDAFSRYSTSLGQQWLQSSKRAKKLHHTMMKIKGKVVDDVFRGAVVNYAEVLAMLEQAKE